MIPEELEYTLEAVDCPLKRQEFIDDWHKLDDDGKALILSVISLPSWQEAVNNKRKKQLGID